MNNTAHALSHTHSRSLALSISHSFFCQPTLIPFVVSVERDYRRNIDSGNITQVLTLFM